MQAGIPLELACDDGVNLEPEGILVKRVIKDGADILSQGLIQWKGQGMENATWEEEFYIKSQFPHLKKQVLIEQGMWA